MEKLSGLVKSLLNRSKSGLVDWQPTTYDNAFQASLASGSFIIREIAGEFEANDYRIDLVNDSGQTVESFTDVELDGAVVIQTIPGRGKFHYVAMGELYSLARRAALGVDKLLDDLLSELDRIGEV